MPKKYDEGTAAAIQSAVNDKLPPGFCLHSAAFTPEPGGKEVWFDAQFSYCDRDKFISIRTPESAHDLDPANPGFIQYVVDIIKAEPGLT